MDEMIENDMVESVSALLLTGINPDEPSG